VGTTATMRKGPPLPPFIFIGKAIMKAPFNAYQYWQHFYHQNKKGS
jgi:hypothetical protein